MNVPFFDLTAQYQTLRDDILAALDDVCRHASFILGEQVAAFEKEFAAYIHTRHCIAVNSGTSASGPGSVARAHAGDARVPR
jgi:dTDP-4-amino-4,6-dideoxygalactose transaminase